MTSKLSKDIKQKRPFRSAQQEAFLLIQRTASELNQELAELLKPAGLTPAKYNALRILRGAGEAGLACRDIADRLVNHDPDVTRLLDWLEAQGFVSRSRESEDRRVVTVRITDEGLAVLSGLDEPVAALHAGQLGHIEDRRLAKLMSRLEQVRSRAP